MPTSLSRYNQAAGAWLARNGIPRAALEHGALHLWWRTLLELPPPPTPLSAVDKAMTEAASLALRSGVVPISRDAEYDAIAGREAARVGLSIEDLNDRTMDLLLESSSSATNFEANRQMLHHLLARRHAPPADTSTVRQQGRTRGASRIA